MFNDQLSQIEACDGLKACFLRLITALNRLGFVAGNNFCIVLLRSLVECYGMAKLLASLCVFQLFGLSSRQALRAEEPRVCLSVMPA